MESGDPGAVLCREMTRPDQIMAHGLLDVARPSVAGLTSPVLYRALCRESLARGNPVMVVAEVDGALAGFVMAVTDPKAFWRSFLRRHPLIAVRILARRMPGLIRARIPRRAAPVLVDRGEHRPAESRTAEGASWEQSGPEIARIVFIGVDEAHRGRGVARALYRHLFAVLEGRGIRRANARIDVDNAPSIRLHRLTGWQIGGAGPSLLATLELPVG